MANAILKAAVKLTANFERDLKSIAQFSLDTDAPQAFDVLLDALLEKVIPNLMRFPELGHPFLDLQARSIESLSAQEALREKAGDNHLRQYALSDYLVLYAISDNTLHLLSVKHHKQLSFDLDAMWLADAGVRGSKQSGG